MRLALVILAILAERGPNTGYGIGRLLRSELRHISNARLQQVYVELAALNQAGFVSLDAVQNGPNDHGKKVYRITLAGEAQLNRSLAEPPAHAHRDGLLLHLVCLERLGKRGITHHLNSRIDEYHRVTTELEGRLLSEGGTPVGPKLALEFELHRTRAELDWCERTLRLVEAGEFNFERQPLARA